MLKLLTYLRLFVLVHITLGWEAFLERFEIKYVDRNVINVNATFYKYNRTHTACSGEVELMVDAPPEIILLVKAYGLYSNKYVALPLQVKRTLCDFFKYEYNWVKSDVTGYVPDRCPVKKGYYYVKDYVLNVNKFPAKPWDTNNYMIDGKLLYKNKTYAWGLLYVRTTTDDEIIKG